MDFAPYLYREHKIGALTPCRGEKKRGKGVSSILFIQVIQTKCKIYTRSRVRRVQRITESVQRIIESNSQNTSILPPLLSKHLSVVPESGERSRFQQALMHCCFWQKQGSVLNCIHLPSVKCAECALYQRGNFKGQDKRASHVQIR